MEVLSHSPKQLVEDRRLRLGIIEKSSFVHALPELDR
jgi:hypothetical protein